MPHPDVLVYDSSTQQYLCKGDWSLSNLPLLEKILSKLEISGKDTITLNGEHITKMDSAGAWVIDRFQEKLNKHAVALKLAAFPERYKTLIALVDQKLEGSELTPPKEKQLSAIANFGSLSLTMLGEFKNYLSFIGLLTLEFLRVLPFPSRYRWAQLANIIYRNGVQALPIIALLSFMIGVVLTYQMAVQLRNYGADAYIVDLLGLATLREFGPLLTAIMVAGRTGSAFTAQLGIMKINEEIDALTTMGITPSELLLLPRVFGLLIALPLLTMWADIFGVVGGMIMSYNMLGITWYDFLHRFSHVIPLKSLIIGLGKAPVFALLIASIGCFEGMQVQHNANSLGRNTTRSVVLSIFFIIVADAVFSVIFSELNL